METCFATSDCINKHNDAAYEAPARACEGWKLRWIDPGPEVKVIHAVVPGPFESLKILKAVPYKVVSKCGSCAARDRRRLRNGIPDAWLEYLEHDAWKERREDEDESAEPRDVRLVKKCIKITDFVWHKKGLALLQGIPDPWKSDLPCECEIKKKSKDRRRKSDNDKFSRRRSSMNKEEIRGRKTRDEEVGTPGRKSRNEEESAGRRGASLSEERSRTTNHDEKSPSHRSTINEEFPRRRSSDKHGENSRRRSKNDDEAPVRRPGKSVEKMVKCAICYAAEPSKSLYACYGGIVPACLRHHLVEEHSKRRSKCPLGKSVKCWIKGCNEEPAMRSSKKCDQEMTTKRKNKNCDEEPTKRKSRNYENEVVEDSDELAECQKKCHRKRPSKSTNKTEKKESTGKHSEAASEDSSELSAEALKKKSRKRSDTAKHKVEQGKASRSVKKLKTRGSGFDKVKQRLQELDNDLKTKGAAKELKLREMEELLRLRKRACKEKRKCGKAPEASDSQNDNGWLNDPDEPEDKIRSAWDEPTSHCLQDGVTSSKANEEKRARPAKISTCHSSKNFNRWLDDPGTDKKKHPKGSKGSKKIEGPRVTPEDTRESKPQETPVKSIRKDTTRRTCSPQATVSTCARTTAPRSPSPCLANPRRVSYADEPQPTPRTSSPYVPNQRRVSYRDEPRSKSYPASRVDGAVFTPRSDSSKSPRCASILRSSSAASPKESKASLRKFLEEINSRIEITQDVLNSPCMKSAAVPPFRADSRRTCPGKALCPRMRAGGDEGLVRRIRVAAADDNKVGGDGVELGAIYKFDGDESDEDREDSDASDGDAGDDRAYLQRSYRRCSMADFKRRQKEIQEIDELLVESFSERDV